MASRWISVTAATRPSTSCASTCYRVASTVGLICLEVFGYRNPASRDYAVDLGIALQLTNILRDVPVDFANGRLYVPLDELARFGCTEDDVRAGRLDARMTGTAGASGGTGAGVLPARRGEAARRRSRPPRRRRDHERDLSGHSRPHRSETLRRLLRGRARATATPGAHRRRDMGAGAPWRQRPPCLTSSSSAAASPVSALPSPWCAPD